MKTKMIVFSLLIMSWPILAQHEHHAASNAEQTTNASAKFKDAKLGSTYELYLKLKDALVASNADDAKAIVIDLKKSLKEMKAPKAATEAAEQVLKAANLKEQRQKFSALSNEMATLVKGGKLSNGELYLEYCPMANNNTGAYWLSNEKEIKNPYFGKMMLTCGSVKETIH
jgi:hypothetical protein